jgi:hypothetical protein
VVLVGEGQDAAGKLARSGAASATDAGMTALYGAAEPVTDALRRMEAAEQFGKIVMEWR